MLECALVGVPLVWSPISAPGSSRISFPSSNPQLPWPPPLCWTPPPPARTQVLAAPTHVLFAQVLSPRPRLYVGRLLPVPCEAPSAAGCPCSRLPHTCRGLTSTGLPPCLLLNSKEIPGDLRGRSWWGRGDASSTPAPGVRSLSWSQGSPGSDRQ